MNTELLIDIARCPKAHACLSEKENHPCRRIVFSQDMTNPEEFQTPEPWSGRIKTAPILFLSSNPSISSEEVFPTWNWADADIADFFQNRFGSGRQPWIIEGTRSLRKGEGYGPWTRFWSGVKGRARELLEREPIPGIDYALTELVQCKSQKEAGVPEALDHCFSRYLDRILEASGARVMVGLGALA